LFDAPGELAKHAVSEEPRAVTKFSSSWKRESNRYFERSNQTNQIYQFTHSSKPTHHFCRHSFSFGNLPWTVVPG
jgi:hypothetical protein